MRTDRRGLLVLGFGAAAGLLAGCQPEAPKAPLEPAAGTAKAVLFAEGMH